MSEKRKVIFHIDVNSAFLSWEAVDRLKQGETLDLRTIPSAVGGDVESRHGIILAKSIPAKKYKVTTGEPVVDALRKCPDLVLVPPNRVLYREMSHKFMDILAQYSDKVEQASIDEAFVDMTGTGLLFGTPEEAAHKIRNQVRDELGFTVNVGISTNKLLAKMASDFTKPDRVHTLWPEEITAKMWPLSTGDLLFAGKSTQRKLRSMGIFTIGDLAGLEKQTLERVFGRHGEYLYNASHGIGSDEIITEREDNKGYSHSTTVPFDITEAEEAKKVLLRLTDQVAQRLRKDGVKAQSIGVTIRYKDLSRVSHQCGLSADSCITSELYAAVCRLFDEKWDNTPIRLLGVFTKAAQEDSGRQMSLFDDTDYEKLEKLDHAMDAIRDRFGRGAIMRASGLTPKSKE